MPPLLIIKESIKNVLLGLALLVILSAIFIDNIFYSLVLSLTVFCVILLFSFRKSAIYDSYWEFKYYAISKTKRIYFNEIVSVSIRYSFYNIHNRVSVTIIYKQSSKEYKFVQDIDFTEMNFLIKFFRSKKINIKVDDDLVRFIEV